MPTLKKKFLYYTDYATAHLSNTFTPEQMQGMKELKAMQLKNCRLENPRNGKLVLHELPPSGQFSTIKGAVSIAPTINGVRQILQQVTSILSVCS